MFESGPEIVTATVMLFSLVGNSIQFILSRKHVSVDMCNTLRDGCNELKNKIAKVEEHGIKILGLESQFVQLTKDMGTVRGDFEEGAKDRRRIRESYENLAEHVRLTDKAMKLFIKIAKSTGMGNKDEVLDELILIFEDKK